ncbi:unnamed protein product [Cuscuta epithymum]|uniref:Uncharacterized protein n=1 Tax=Cuscuta epithymum TaxID=186058 RepID=A0AAV0DDH2_9ASTE|nr:unnamed protein product [Cuscuta epithymum]
MAPRQNHTRGGGASSSRGNTGRYQPRFPQLRDELKHTELLQKPMGTFYFPDEDSLTAEGVRDDVMFLLRRGWWRHLFFGIRDMTYREITCEVLATFKMPKVIPIADNRRPVIKFRAFEEDHAISMAEVRYHLGFTGIEDDGQHEASLTDFPPGVDRQAFWESITRDGGTYRPKMSPNTLLYPRQYRIIHALLSSTITGKAEVASKVTQTDLFCLYCMIHNRKPHMGYLIAKLLHRQATNHIKAIYVGPFITRLLTGMGFGGRFLRMEESSSFVSLTRLPEVNTGVARSRTQPAAAVGGGGQRADDDDDDDVDDDDEVEMEAAAHEVPYDAPPYDTAFPDSWAGMHEHQDVVYWQLSAEQHERFDQMRFEQQDFYREMREDQTLHYSQLQSQYTWIDERLTSMETSWSSFFDAYPPPPPPEY